jgi:hypothetical protein
MQQPQGFPGGAFNANPMQPQARPPVRVRAHKGFFATVNGQFSKVNPGDVVELEYVVARDAASKVEPVPHTTALLRQENYLPERKRNPKPDPGTEIAALRASVDALTKAVTLLLEREAQPAGKVKG